MAWYRPQLPTREALLAQRWTRPFAKRLGAPVLWRWNRRSVARGLALGLFIGIMVPLVQSPIAALAAVATRANLAIAVVATFVTNPLTTPVVFVTAYQIGSLLIMAEASNPIVDMGDTMAWLEQVLNWLVTASLPTALGLLAMASTAALAGYFGVQLWWRWRVGRRWSRRRALRQARSRSAASAGAIDVQGPIDVQGTL